MPELQLNYWTIAVGAGFNVALGMFWYSPMITGRAWMRAIGITIEDIKEAKISMNAAYIASTFTAIVLSLSFAVFVSLLGLQTFASGAFLGAAAWFAFNFTSMLKLVFWEDRPWGLFWIDGGYDIISFITIGGLIAAWR